MSITHFHVPSSLTWPAWKDWLQQRVEQFQNWRQVRRQQRIDRQAFQQMLYLDEHLLRDIGHQRSALEDVNNLPLDVNAAAAVRMLRQERRTQQARRDQRGSRRH